MINNDINITIKPVYDEFIKIVDNTEEKYKKIDTDEITLNNSIEKIKMDEQIVMMFKKLHNLIETVIFPDEKKVNFDDETNNESIFIEKKKNNNSERKAMKKKYKISNLNDNTDTKQKEKLERLYEKKMEEQINNTLLTEKKHKTYKDKLKEISKDFEEKCIMQSTNGFNIKDELYYIDMKELEKNIKKFNELNEYDKNTGEKYECVVFYKNYINTKLNNKIDNDKGWIELSRNNKINIPSNNKFLRASIKLFDTTNKFRKIINGYKTRAFKNTFYIYKSNIKIELFSIIKLK